MAWSGNDQEINNSTSPTRSTIPSRQSAPQSRGDITIASYRKPIHSMSAELSSRGGGRTHIRTASTRTEQPLLPGGPRLRKTESSRHLVPPSVLPDDDDDDDASVSPLSTLPTHRLGSTTSINEMKSALSPRSSMTEEQRALDSQNKRLLRGKELSVSFSGLDLTHEVPNKSQKETVHVVFYTDVADSDGPGTEEDKGEGEGEGGTWNTDRVFFLQSHVQALHSMNSLDPAGALTPLSHYTAGLGFADEIRRLAREQVVDEQRWRGMVDDSECEETPLGEVWNEVVGDLVADLRSLHSSPSPADTVPPLQSQRGTEAFIDPGKRHRSPNTTAAEQASKLTLEARQEQEALWYTWSEYLRVDVVQDENRARGGEGYIHPYEYPTDCGLGQASEHEE